MRGSEDSDLSQDSDKLAEKIGIDTALNQLETAEELLEIQQRKITQKKAEVYSQINLIKVHKNNLVKLMGNLSTIDRQETTKVFDWKPFEDFRKISGEINKTLQEKASGQIDFWNYKNDDFYKKRVEILDDKKDSNFKINTINYDK